MDSYLHDGLVFGVRDAGPADGEPIVLLHGFPQDAGAWDGVVASLTAAGLRTLAPAQRGYSPGARPAGRRNYRLSRCAEDVVALLDAAGLSSAHVVGHDWGGAVAWVLAARHADRVRTATVLSTPHPVALSRALRGAQALRSWYMAFFQLPVLPELLLRQRGPVTGELRATGLPADAAGRYAAGLAEPGAAGAMLNWYRALPWSLREPVGRSRVPTTYAWGRNDFALGRRAAELTAAFAAADYRFAEVDAGHWLPEVHPELVAELVLERVRPAPGQAG